MWYTLVPPPSKRALRAEKDFLAFAGLVRLASNRQRSQQACTGCACVRGGVSWVELSQDFLILGSPTQPSAALAFDSVQQRWKGGKLFISRHRTTCNMYMLVHVCAPFYLPTGTVQLITN